MTAITAEADASVPATAVAPAPPLAEVVDEVVEEVVASALLRHPKLVLMAADLVMVAVSVLAAYQLERGSIFQLGLDAGAERFLALAMVTLPVWLGDLRQPAALQHPLHRPPDRRDPPHRQRRRSSASWPSRSTGYFVGDRCPAAARSSCSSCRASSLVVVEREVARRMFAALRARGPARPPRGHRRRQPRGPRAGRPCSRPSPWLGYRVLGLRRRHRRPTREPVAGVPLLGTVGDAADIVRAPRRAPA